jgi:hypothetical protein
VEEERNEYRVLVGNLKEREDLDNLGVDGRINVQLILTYDEVASTASVWLRVGTGEHLVF